MAFKFFNKTPFPQHNSPTNHQCEEVLNLLTTIHGSYDMPSEMPDPSLTIAGCGEVPDLLDAILRVRLSAATMRSNADNMLKNLVKTFGTRTVPGFPPTVNWPAVHSVSVADLEAVIHCGGLALSRARDIKAILKSVYETNVKRQQELIKERETRLVKEVREMEDDEQVKKDAELTCLNDNLFTLEHLRELDTISAIKSMMLFNGIGIKSASCVILFGFRRPSFAVDTHVQRLCKWLGWVPPNSNEVQTYAHCEFLVPDHLKYGLHQLLIVHGMNCLRCKAQTSPSTKGWDHVDCPLEQLVTREDDGNAAKRKKSLPTKEKEKENQNGKKDILERVKKPSPVKKEEKKVNSGRVKKVVPTKPTRVLPPRKAKMGVQVKEE